MQRKRKCFFSSALFVTQRVQWLNCRRPASWDESRNGGKTDHYRDCNNDGDSIIGLQPEKNAPDVAARSSRNADTQNCTDQNQQHSLAHDETQYVDPLRTERHPDADLICTLSNAGQNAIKAHARQEEREYSTERREVGKHLFLCERAIDLLSQSPDVGYG